MIEKREKKEASVDYPCEWIYKVIGCDKESVHNAIASIIQDNEYQINDSNTSKTGKYLHNPKFFFLHILLICYLERQIRKIFLSVIIVKQN